MVLRSLIQEESGKVSTFSKRCAFLEKTTPSQYFVIFDQKKVFVEAKK
jgi:hypothetical protein